MPAVPSEPAITAFPFKLLAPIAIILILIAGISLRVVNFNNVTRRSPDEGVYTHQAKAIALEGPMAGTRSLISEYDMNKELWLYPPPTRIGYNWLLGGIMKMTGHTGADTGAYLSTMASIAALFLVALIGLRFFNPLITVFALLFLAVSPMDLAIARRTWQDAFFGCVGLSMAYLTLEITRNPRNFLWQALVIVLGSYITLVKEPGLAVYGLCGMWITGVLLFKERSPASCIRFVALSLAGLFASAALLSYVAGGPGMMLQIFDHIRTAMPTNTYAVEYQSGPLYYFLQGFWIVSAASTILFIIGAASALLPFGLEDNDAGSIRISAIWLLFFGLAFFAIALFTPYCQNMRYVSVSYGPFYLLAGVGLWYLVSAVKPAVKDITAVGASILAVALLLAAISDYQMYQKIFLRTGIVDVSVKMLRDYSK